MTLINAQTISQIFEKVYIYIHRIHKRKNWIRLQKDFGPIVGRYQFRLNMLLNEEISTWNGMHLKLFIFARRVKPYNYKARDYASRFFSLTASPTQCSIALSFHCFEVHQNLIS